MAEKHLRAGGAQRAAQAGQLNRRRRRVLTRRESDETTPAARTTKQNSDELLPVNISQSAVSAAYRTSSDGESIIATRGPRALAIRFRARSSSFRAKIAITEAAAYCRCGL